MKYDNVIYTIRANSGGGIYIFYNNIYKPKEFSWNYEKKLPTLEKEKTDEMEMAKEEN